MQRIATSTTYAIGIGSVNKQQSLLNEIQGQVGSGLRVTTAADDPVAAAQASRVQHAQATLTQYSSNLGSASASLGQLDTTMSSIVDVEQSMQTLLVQAGDATLGNSGRQSVATQLQALRDQAMSLANTQDSQGNYIFGGTQTSATPFANAASGGATYSGTQQKQMTQVSANGQIAVTEDGSALFMRVDSSAKNVASAAATNTGSGKLGTLSVDDASNAANGDNFSIQFTVANNATTYTVTDNTTGLPVSQDQPYTEGGQIALGGQNLTLSGTPADGDSFSVQPAASADTDFFKSVDDVIAALKTDTVGTANDAKLSNVLSTASTKLGNALNTALGVQAGVGARESEADALTTSYASTSLQNKSQLSSLVSADVVTAYATLSEAQTTLEASQKTFIQVQSLSLFSLLHS
jgi:flagellar hook-associated protein 3 FlgL